MAAPTGFETFAGLSRHSWIDRPDTKYNTDGLFKTKLVGDLADPKVQAFKAKVDVAAQAAFDEELKDLSPGQRKKWSLYLPYTLEEDEEGNETGRIVFEFKRNALVTNRVTGQSTSRVIAVFDSRNSIARPTPVVPHNSLIRVAATSRAIKLSYISKSGVWLDFFAVKVLKMARMPCPFSEDQIAEGWIA